MFLFSFITLPKPSGRSLPIQSTDLAVAKPESNPLQEEVEKIQEVTVSRADVKEISVEAVVAVVLSELGDIFAGKQITGLRVFYVFAEHKSLFVS